jgi:hypothetical protein
MTEHDREFQALARRIKELQRDAELSSWGMDFIPLTLFVLCLLVLDTQTWLQRLLLLFLAFTAACLLWLGLHKVDPQK